MNLFNILKINTSYIIQNNLNIKISYEDAISNNMIVALGDNQLFKFIRRLHNNEKILDEIAELKVASKLLQKQSNSKQNIEILRNINNKIKLLSFVPDIVSIKVNTTKKDYKIICKNLFTVEINVFGVKYKKTYKRICAGAGQLRHNSALFVDVDLYDELELIMMCGLTKNRIGKINLAKFSAYFALYTSATREVSYPNICVVKDFEYVLHNQSVDWIYDNDENNKCIERRQIDFEINAFDGSGMISPRMAERWKTDLDLDYLPSSFIIRSAWIKGLVSVFDFHKFAKEIANKNYIIDAWGNKKDIDNIDIILTTSQFKMYKKYDSWEEYVYYHRKFKHIFSVARASKKENNILTPLNYQYIQTNDFTKETIYALSDYSINWISKIMNKDYLYTALFLLHVEDDYNNILFDNNNSLDATLSKAMLYCPNILHDEYFNKRMIKLVQNKLDKMKIGKIFVEGSYEFMIPDLYAMAEHAFGMDVKGLLPVDSIWNYRWVKKGSKQVTAHRSPLVAPSENRILNVYNNVQCEEWFKYINSGNMFNIWDMTVISMSDAD